MLRSLYSGVAGMQNHQTRMDVVGNNISNVNTNAYKAGRANFQDTLYQTLQSAGEKTNPAQAGLGIGMAGITSQMGQGALQSTGRTLDVAIDGNGFYKVTDGSSEFFTRDGVFSLTEGGELVDSNGNQVMGETWNKAKVEYEVGNVDPESDSIVSAGGDLELRGTLKDGSQKDSDTIVSLEADMTLKEVIDKINEKKDESGVEASYYTKTNDSDEEIKYLKFTSVYDEPTNPEDVDTVLHTPGASDGLTFDIEDDLADGSNGPSTEENNPYNHVTDAEIEITNMPVASMNIQNNGIITGTDTNGDELKFANEDEEKDMGRISLNIFNNENGLERASENLFEKTVASGDPEQGTPGDAGYGELKSGYIEMSNVELTDEFTDMITTQRGYQANSRIITVSDSMLEELINLKR